MKYYLNSDLDIKEYAHILNCFLEKTSDDSNFIRISSLITKEKIEELMDQLDGEMKLIFYDFRSLNMMLTDFRLLHLALINEGVEIEFLNEPTNFLEIIMEVIDIDLTIKSGRVKEGIVKAKKEGKIVGRPVIDTNVADKIYYLHKEKKQNLRQISEECGVSLGTVHKYIHRFN